MKGQLKKGDRQRPGTNRVQIKKIPAQFVVPGFQKVGRLTFTKSLRATSQV